MHTLSTDHDGKSVQRTVGILDAPQNRKVVGIVGNKESGSQSVLTESNKSSTQWKLRKEDDDGDYGCVLEGRRLHRLPLRKGQVSLGKGHKKGLSALLRGGRGRDPTEFAPLQPGYFGGRVGHPRGILPRLGFARFAVVGEVIRSGVL